MRFLSLLLALLMTVPSGAVRLTATIGESELLSDGALSALSALADSVELRLSTEGFDLSKNGELLLCARTDDSNGVIACGDAAASFDVPAGSWKCSGSEYVCPDRRRMGKCMAAGDRDPVPCDTFCQNACYGTDQR